MALPWQGDTSRCRSGYDPDLSPTLPTFWPARVPNQVLTEATYKTLSDTSQSKTARMKAYQYRSNWLRNVLDHSGPDSAEIHEKTMENMVRDFHKMGIVTRRDTPADMTGMLPPVLYVESLPPTDAAHGGVAAAGSDWSSFDASASVDPDDRKELLRRAGWTSEAQLAAFRRGLK
jgi:hypothetical protein